MLLVSGLKVVRAHGEVELILAEIVGLLATVDPGELELVRRLAAVRKVGEREARSLKFARRLEAERFIVELETLLEVKHIEIIVGKLEFHNHVSFCRSISIPISRGSG